VTRPAPKEEAVREELRERRDGPGAAEDAAAPEPQPQPDPLTKAEAERDEYLELARRTQADFENYR
jgi:molecular chaperone GrpE (heat shock protein)